MAKGNEFRLSILIFLQKLLFCGKKLSLILPIQPQAMMTGPRSAVGNVSGYRCVSDCRSRGREFDPGPVPYFHGD